jgi:hypothetical protein
MCKDLGLILSTTTKKNAERTERERQRERERERERKGDFSLLLI